MTTCSACRRHRSGLRRYCFRCDATVGPLHRRRHRGESCLFASVGEFARHYGGDPVAVERAIAEVIRERTEKR